MRVGMRYRSPLGEPVQVTLCNSYDVVRFGIDSERTANPRTDRFGPPPECARSSSKVAEKGGYQATQPGGAQIGPSLEECFTEGTAFVASSSR
jgi:hypothetical protein